MFPSMHSEFSTAERGSRPLGQKRGRTNLCFSPWSFCAELSENFQLKLFGTWHIVLKAA